MMMMMMMMTKIKAAHLSHVFAYRRALPIMIYIQQASQAYKTQNAYRLPSPFRQQFF